MNHSTNGMFFDEVNRMIGELARLAHAVCEQAENGRPVLDRAREFEGTIYQLRREIERVRPQYEQDYLRSSGTAGEPRMRETQPVHINPILQGIPEQMPDADMWNENVTDFDNNNDPMNHGIDSDDEMRMLQEEITNLGMDSDVNELQRLLETSERMANSGGGITGNRPVNRIQETADKMPKNYQNTEKEEKTEEETEVPRNRLNSVD